MPLWIIRSQTFQFMKSYRVATFFINTSDRDSTEYDKPWTKRFNAFGLVKVEAMLTYLNKPELRKQK